MDERSYWLGFSVFPGIGPFKFRAILQRFGSAKDAWGAPVSNLSKVVGKITANKFDRFRNQFSIKLYMSRLKEKRVSFVLIKDREYPEILAQIKNPPFVLYIKGNIKAVAARGPIPGFLPASAPLVSPRQGRGTERVRAVGSPSTRATPRSTSPLASPAAGSSQTIAVVGTRRITNYGREVTEMFVRELADAGFTIVSGLALGVDAQAHKSALEAGGKTIAVLGCGVDCCTPRENQALYNSIVKGSPRFGEAGNNCVISELPLDHPPTKGSFPSRNRIIAGLALGVLVTEGAEDSGSLITADYAFKFNRKVFAVPGPITSSLSKGPYSLIKKGAKLVTTGEDIIKELGIRSIKSTTSIKGIKGETKEEQTILEILQNEPMHFDEVVRRSGFDSGRVGSILSIMDIKGLIKSIDGSIFDVIRET